MSWIPTTFCPIFDWDPNRSGRRSEIYFSLKKPNFKIEFTLFKNKVKTPDKSSNITTEVPKAASTEKPVDKGASVVK